MRSGRVRRWLAVGLLVVGAGTLAQVPVNCFTFAAQTGVMGIDFCSLFDCQNGILGGLIRPCGDPTTAEDDLFADCPQIVGTGQ